MTQTRFDISLYNVETAPYRSLDLRGKSYPHWILSHILHGEVTTETGGETAAARKGDVMIHSPNLPFSESAAGPGTHQWTLFDAALSDGEASYAPPDLLTRFPLPLVVSLGERAARYAETFAALEAAWREENADELRVAALAGLLFSEIVGAWRDAGSPPRPSVMQTPRGRFAELIGFMEGNLASRLNRDELARRAYLHPGSFDRAFRVAHGIPPMRLLLDMRLSRARRLLETGDHTLEAIARAVGLRDAPRLSRHFRARYGIAPGAHRTRIKESVASLYLSPKDEGI